MTLRCTTYLGWGTMLCNKPATWAAFDADDGEAGPPFSALCDECATIELEMDDGMDCIPFYHILNAAAYIQKGKTYD